MDPFRHGNHWRKRNGVYWQTLLVGMANRFTAQHPMVHLQHLSQQTGFHCYERNVVDSQRLQHDQVE